MSTYRNDTQARQRVVDGLRHLVEVKLTSGTAGNVSARTEHGMLITPTGVAPGDLEAASVVAMQLDGTVDADQLLPSSEWRMHADIYANKPEVDAVVHCHSNYATILACAHKSIPAQHYMIAATGSHEIPLAEYAIFGSQELSNATLAALSTSSVCLLANHGQITTGGDLKSALKLAELVEELAYWHWGALAIGGPKVLSEAQMDEVIEAFETYGQQRATPAPDAG